MTRALERMVVLALLVAVVLLCSPSSAGASDLNAPGVPERRSSPDLPIPDIPVPDLPDLPGGVDLPLPGLGDCQTAPTPDMPGRGLGGFFSTTPNELPDEADPFAAGSSTTIYEQYGYAGLRWQTYDLGCGPDMMRQPDAVIGTSTSNWLMQAPIALTALTGSLTQVAFNPSFLDVFDVPMTRVSKALHESMFASWAPGIIALIGILVILRSRAQALSTTAGVIGWAILVILLTTAVFRWPLAAGQAADATVTETLGAVVGELGGQGEDVDPGTAVSSNVHEAILFRAWLAGTFGSPDSQTARTYGDELFAAQALTWREAELVNSDPKKGAELISRKQEEYKEIAEKIKTEDPDAYEYLTGKRSETRVGYAALAALAAFLSLPFLLVSALLMLGCFLIVRLAVMMLPAFAVMGLFPATREVVLGLGRTVGAAVVNAIIFGVGAGVTVAVIGILFQPGAGTPAWLSLVLMPLFTFMMWVALKPFRRLTTVVRRGNDPFGDMTQSFGRAARSSGRLARRAVVTGAAAATGGTAAAVAAEALDDDTSANGPPQRAESRPARFDRPAPEAKTTNAGRTHATSTASRAGSATAGDDMMPPDIAAPVAPSGRHRASVDASPAPRAAIDGYAPIPTSTGVPPAPTEPEWIDGEDIYRIYRPNATTGDDAA